MTFLSTTLTKIFLILFFVSYITIAGPVPDVVGNDLSLEGREPASGGSVHSSKQAAGGDLSSSNSDSLSDNDGKVDLKKQTSQNKGVGGSSLAGTRQKQGNTVQSVPQGGSEQGGSVSGGEGEGGLLNILSGNGGHGGGEKGGLSILDILRRNL